MDDSDKEDFHKLMDKTFMMYSKPAPATELVAMYFQALIKYQFDEIWEAINRHVVDTDAGQYLPKPADIVRHITGNTSTQAEMAWTKVDNAIRTVGPHQSVCFDDKVIHAVIEDMGGWILLCDVDDKEYPFKHNEFIKRYRGYAVRPPGQVMRRLIGTAESHNSASEFRHLIPNPILVGDKKQALLILESGRDEKRQTIHRVGGLLTSALKKLTGNSND